MVHARDVRRPNARGRGAQAPSARVAQLEHALAAEQHDASPACQCGDVPERSRRRGQLAYAGRPAARDRGHRHQEPRT
jgi:hypothetical protein